MKDPPKNTSPTTNSMSDSITYPSTPNAYIPPASYYPQSHAGGHVHVVAPQPRTESQQRKRPKYTRSKTGCLTCRVKKIKCDETKPICMRCTHGQRDCTWPEGVPTRKKATPRKENVDGRPSTAESSGISETSTPPTRDNTPPRRNQGDYSLPPVVARRHSEPFVPPLGPEPELSRRQLAPHPYQLHHPSQTNVLSMISEMPTYQSTRYDHAYSGATSVHTAPRHPGSSHPSSHHQLQMRSMTQQSHSHHTHQAQPAQHWSQAQMIPSLNHPMEPFYHNPQERTLVGHSSNDHHPRYQ
ncbi:hypothetical protein EV363DRAFT_1581972 [Boletus edulis]|uniref:Zn(2)-C6 fungal-type domain-containing protein n=1 Tax=Boletus edulis BED1 TaxID=1328754 RepID=A0AAD4BW96_BOLED|nr:hypothetical protein EV363DRAFT_1581972 [Boletus edulis]KAF8441461.1 hypothetical protein L210DRAFT_3537248 [Boletus edulis BED1]